MHWTRSRLDSPVEGEFPRDAGVTLLELLTVCLVIGVLAGVAAPFLLTQRDRARVAVIEADLRNVGTAMEGVFAEQLVYPEVRQEGSNLLLGTQVVRISPGVTVRSVSGLGVAPGSFCIEARSEGSAAVRSFDSDGGGLRSGGCA